MDLAQVTPLILTFNEEANLRETLAGLAWAKRILIIDSGSTDDTLAIVSGFAAVEVIHREFDHFADQCNFGLARVTTPWVLSLDADYKCDSSFAQEITQLDDSLAGYQAKFQYGIYGKPLRATLYPPRVVLYRARLAHYHRDGHAHRVEVEGEIGSIKTPILHDDRKPLSTWFAAQIRYASEEADKLQSSEAGELSWKDRLRTKIVLAPPLTLLYCLVYKRLLLDGWRGLFYSLQRTFAELVLALILLDRKIRSNGAK